MYKVNTNLIPVAVKHMSIFDLRCADLDEQRRMIIRSGQENVGLFGLGPRRNIEKPLEVNRQKREKRLAELPVIYRRYIDESCWSAVAEQFAEI